MASFCEMIFFMCDSKSSPDLVNNGFDTLLLLLELVLTLVLAEGVDD